MANWPPLPAAGTNHENRLIPLHPPLEKGGMGGFDGYFHPLLPTPKFRFRE